MLENIRLPPNRDCHLKCDAIIEKAYVVCEVFRMCLCCVGPPNIDSITSHPFDQAKNILLGNCRAVKPY